MAGRKRAAGSRAPNGAATIYLAKDGRWHGRVTVGTRDDGIPDRRHTSAKTEAEVVRKVRALERDRDSGAVRKVGQHWTVATWLMHWVETIAAPVVREHALGLSRCDQCPPDTWTRRPSPRSARTRTFRAAVPTDG
jgi:integrase